MTKICLVGMSGIGKSWWSKRLSRERGFVVHDCDAAIGLRLSTIVTPEAGEELVTALGRWMGMPWTPGYAEREARYLTLEEEVTREALTAARDGHVLDTTGSVIYLSQALRDAIRSECRVVYLRTPPGRHEAMLRRYLSEPKPVVWSGGFPEGLAEPRRVLPEAYAMLLRNRDRAYAALAHVTLDGGALEAAPPTVERFLEDIVD